MHESQGQHQTYLSLANHHSRFSQALPLPFFPLFGQRCSRMNTFFLFSFFNSRQWGGKHGWDNFFHHHLPFHYYFITHTPYFILLFPPMMHQHNMSMTCFAHHPLSILMSWPATTRWGGKLTCKSPLFQHALIGPYVLIYHISKMSHISPID